ncbi:hypothetical protein Tdes44962_MAKER05752 [Teratosphaeria destructans]|uniref:Uncharacterized protein n=1 Tax=Teratosphaeria destructans TaxID=418781 RepID=A0A9W7SJ40_9PEZI|nr:hypothetical protein Tdes44962_MAKER05752 [Teratosphaeria destructans]
MPQQGTPLFPISEKNSIATFITIPANTTFQTRIHYDPRRPPTSAGGEAPHQLDGPADETLPEADRDPHPPPPSKKTRYSRLFLSWDEGTRGRFRRTTPFLLVPQPLVPPLPPPTRRPTPNGCPRWPGDRAAGTRPSRLGPRIPVRGSGTVTFLRGLVRTRSNLQADARERRAAAWRPPASGHGTLRDGGLEDHPFAHAPPASPPAVTASNSERHARRPERHGASNSSSGSVDFSNPTVHNARSSGTISAPLRPRPSNDTLRQRSLSPSQRALTAAAGNAIPVTPERAERAAAAIQSTGATASVPRLQRPNFLRSAVSVGDLPHSSSPAGTLGNGTTRTDVLISQFPVPPVTSPERRPPTPKASVWSLFPSTPQIRSCPSISRLVGGSIKRARSWSATWRGAPAGETDPDYAPAEASTACRGGSGATEQPSTTSPVGSHADRSPTIQSPAAVVRTSAESERAVGNRAARIIPTPPSSHAQRQSAGTGCLPVPRRSLRGAQSGGVGPRLPIAVQSQAAEALHSLAPQSQPSPRTTTEPARCEDTTTTSQLQPCRHKKAKIPSNTPSHDHVPVPSDDHHSHQSPPINSPPIQLLPTIPNLDGDSAAWDRNQAPQSPLRQTRSDDTHNRHSLSPTHPSIPSVPYALATPGRTPTNLPRCDPPRPSAPAPRESNVLRPEQSHQSITVPSVPSLEPVRSRPNFRIRREGGGNLGRAKATWRTRMAATKCWRCEMHESKLKGWKKLKRAAEFSCCCRFQAYEEDEDSLLEQTAERVIGMELQGPPDGGFGGRQSVEVVGSGPGMREDVLVVRGR